MQKNIIRRFVCMCAGNVIMGLGVALFKLSLMGNDPCNAMHMAIADKIGVPFFIVSIAVSSVWFIAEFLFGRKYVGAGTLVNWFGVGYIATFFHNLITGSFAVPSELLPRLIVMAVGVLVLSLSVSMYQTADMGISPYDSLSVILADRLPVPYFWCRIATDVFCTAVAFAFGGIIGLGTLLCALGLGPFIAFFNRHVSEKLCGISPETDCETGNRP